MENVITEAAQSGWSRDDDHDDVGVGVGVDDYGVSHVAESTKVPTR